MLGLGDSATRRTKQKNWKEKLKGHKSAVMYLSSPDGPEGKILLSLSDDGVLRTWNLAKRCLYGKVELHPPMVVRETSNVLLDQGACGMDCLTRDQWLTVIEENEEAPKEAFLCKLLSSFTACQPGHPILQVKDADANIGGWVGGYTNGVIAVWADQYQVVEIEQTAQGDLRSVLPLHAVAGHEKAVTALDVVGEQLLSSSLDGTIRVWQMEHESLSCLVVLSIGQNNPCIGFVMIDPLNTRARRMVTGSWDGQLRLLDIDMQSCIDMREVAYMAAVKCLVRHTPEDGIPIVYVGTSDCQVSLWRYVDHRLELMTAWKAHDQELTLLRIFENRLYTCAEDASIRIWDEEGVLLDELRGHDGGVLALEFGTELIYTASRDQSVRTWDRKDGESRIRERAAMREEDIMSRRYGRLLDKQNAKKGKKKASGKAKKGGKKKA
jgi:F-box and WD-40 domain protein 1/11/F-box/WD-40 domain protein 7